MSKIENALTFILISVCLAVFTYSAMKNNSEKIEKETLERISFVEQFQKERYDSTVLARTLYVTVEHDKNPTTNTIAVKLSASSSYDNEKDTMGYSWKQIDGLHGLVPTINFKEGSKKSVVSFDATEGNYGFELTVTDSYGVWCKDTQWVNVAPEPNSCPVVIIKDLNKNNSSF